MRPEPIQDLPYGRLYDVPDESAIRLKQVQKNEEAEAKRDKTYDEFMAMFQDHIENKVDPSTRVGGRPETPTGEHVEPKKSTMQANAMIDGRSQHSGLDKSHHHSRYESIKSEGGRSATSSRMVTAKSDKQAQEMKYDLPKSCKLPISRKLIVETLQNGYYLVAHPYPQVEGEMLMFQVTSGLTFHEDSKSQVSKNESIAASTN